jgi:pilus assembly protein CpaB
MHRKGFLLLAMICGLIAAGSTYIYLNGVTQNPPSSLKPLVIVKTNIPARSVIEASQLEVKDIPTQGYPKGGYSSIQNVVGSVALLNLTPGDLIVSSMLERLNSLNQGNGIPAGSTTALTVPDGKRAVAIPIGLVSGVGYAVKPGDHVDVLVTIDIKDPVGNGSQSVTTLAAQDVLVLSVGENLSGDKTKAETKSHTLALSVPQAMAITFGSEKGSIRLLLRNPMNTDIRQDTPVNGNAFLDPNYINRYK